MSAPATSRRATLGSLKPGDRFTALGKRGKVIRLTDGCAVVELVITRTRQFRTRAGELVTIGTNRERTTWSLGTVVEVLDR